MFSEPILKAFEADTGIRVDAVYDVEASKTIGLVNRLIAEKDKPLCDVFWNNEIVQTIRLAGMELLERYKSPNARDLPEAFRHPDGLWTGFAARARAIIYNRDKIAEADVPRSIRQWGEDARYSGRFAVASPLFGTTSSHAAAMLAKWGRENLQSLYAEWIDNEAAVLAGNGTVKNEVADGRYEFGLTDTDDIFSAMDDGKPVGMLFPVEGLLIPNSVALIAGAPHPEAARRLIDYILRPETEEALAHAVSGQIPLRENIARPSRVPAADEVNDIGVDWSKAARLTEEAGQLTNEFLARANRP
ncbi:MAG: putative binding protein component of ABC iron transporter precursor [candidate division BRC1 bacterium ADurb.BinA364]|nr:MAG: putative binding protein component of ABC iron transporter precursor [candidate division BRC1 bacterium ADurb.BinA364]